MIENVQTRLFRSPAGLWEAFVRVKLAGAPEAFVGVVRVDEAAIRDIIASRVAPEDVGFFKAIGKWIAKTAKKVARWKVWKQVGSFIKKVVTSPIVAGIVGVVSTVFPPLGATYAAARSAVAVADGLARGDAKVIGKMGAVAKSALDKNPLARQAVETVRAAEKSPYAQFVQGVTAS
jgi:hypothetical protein